MDTQNKPNPRKNVLGDNISSASVKIRAITSENIKKIAWLFFVLSLIIAITKDLSVFLLSVPTFNDLEIHEGTIEFIQGGRRNSYLSLNTGDETISFTCWISSGGTSNCIKKDQRNIYVGKKAKIYSNRALINGVLHENRLLQLEVNDEVIISYEQQKTKYLQKKGSYLYLQTLLGVIALFGLVVVYFKNRIREDRS